jgi:predicted ribosome quality control (RQC) complex YloA/Tae2 family protein
VDERTIKEVVEELRSELTGRFWGKVFQPSRDALAVDFHLSGGRYLLLSAEPERLRLHLIARKLRELEKSSLPSTPFSLALRKWLGGATLTDISKAEGERVVLLRFRAHDEAGRERRPALVAQLTGRSANLLLLDDEGRVVDTLRPARGAGQTAGEPYAPPARHDAAAHARRPDASPEAAHTPRPGLSLSETLDEFYSAQERERAFDARASALDARLRQEADKRRKLLRNLREDLARHGDADAQRRAGELLLANLTTAERTGARVRLTDYYAEGAPTIELEIDEHRSLQEEAAHLFSRYAKAKRAAEEVARRIDGVGAELSALEARRAALAGVVAGRDAAALEEFEGESGGRRGASAPAGQKQQRAKAGKKKDEGVAGVRRFRSTDGYEILVGRGARDNDHLTFRVARSHDLWLHAADYPGSHVVVRTHKKADDIPQRTVIEAAQLAAHFSRAGRDSKVAVHYTERKFVSKIKGGAPGLVRLASFRTIMVEPRADLERI